MTQPGMCATDASGSFNLDDVYLKHVVWVKAHRPAFVSQLRMPKRMGNDSLVAESPAGAGGRVKRHKRTLRLRKGGDVA